MLIGGVNQNGQCLGTILLIDPLFGTFRQISSDLPPLRNALATSLANGGVLPGLLPEVVVVMGGQSCGPSAGAPLGVVAIDTTGRVASLGPRPEFLQSACRVGMGSASADMSLVCPSATYAYGLQSKAFQRVANYSDAPPLPGPLAVASLFGAELAVLDAAAALWAVDPFRCPYNCSGRGQCRDGLCNCPLMYQVCEAPSVWSWGSRAFSGGGGGEWRGRAPARSPDGLFAQREREPIGGRPAVRGKRAYGGRPGQRMEEQGTWASRTQKHSEAGYGRPVDRGTWTANTVKRPRQQPAHPRIRQLLGAADAQTAHPATSSTAPTHQILGSANAETTPARAPAAAANRKQRSHATCEGKNG